MPDFTIAGLSARISTTIDHWNTFLDQTRFWLAGTPEGGPENDGRYPLTNGVGLTLLVPCPAALADEVSGPAAAALAAKVAAETASSIAASHAATAEEQADLAEAAKVAVLAALSDAEAAAEAAEGHAADAAASLASTITLTDDLADAVATNVQNTSDIANAVAYQATLADLVEEARDDATAAASTATTQAGLANAAKIAAEAARDDAESIVTGDLTGALIVSKLGYTPANKAGDDFTGTTSIRGNAATSRELGFKTGSNFRWKLIADNVAEGGSNAGSNLRLSRFSDAGSLIDAVVIVNRATGVLDFAFPPTIGGASLLSSTAPVALASSAAAGSATSAAREDHVHQFPLATVSQTLTGAGSLASSDHGKVVEWNAANGTLTLPNSLPVGFNCIVRVIHASGIPTFTAASGATIRQADSLTKARKQWSEVSVSVRANSGGTAAEYILSGDMA
jgi:hypothetical protein